MPPASTRTAGLQVLGRLDDIVVTGGVNVPAPAVARRLREHPAVHDGRGARCAGPGVGQPAGRLRRGRSSTWTQARDWVAEDHPRSWAPRQVVALDGDPDARQRQAGPGRAAGARMRVFAIPLRTRFRGITVREGVLLARARAGWGEWSPFLEYDARVAEPWLRCAEEAAAGDWPTPVRDRVPVNVTVPAVGPEQAHRIADRRRLPHRQGQGRRARPDRSPTTRPGSRRCATRSGRTRRSGSMPTAAGRSTRRSPAIRAAGPGGRWAGVRRAALCLASRTSPLVPPPGRRADRRRRVDPPGRGPLPGPRPRGRGHRRAQGAAARRGPRVPADRRGHRAAGRRLLRARDLGRDRGRAGARRRAARAALRLRPGDRRSCSPPTWPPRRCSRSTASCPSVRPTVDPAALAGSSPRRSGWRTGRPGWPRCEALARMRLVSATDLARAVVTALVKAGVTDDRRGARGRATRPLAFAAYDAAEAGLVRLHTRIDERSAGFLALGLTKAGARAAVVCTSGTAVANLHPAMLEAVHAGVPIVAVTADRPERLRGTSANQTTEQVGVFGWLVPVVDVAERRPAPVVGRGPAAPQRPARRPTGARRTGGLPDGARVRPAGAGRVRSREVLDPRTAHGRGGGGRCWSAGAHAGRGGGLAAARPSRPAAPATATHALRCYRLLLDGDLGAQHRAGRGRRASDAVAAGDAGCSPATTSRSST